MTRLVAITIDTEVDKDQAWRIASPATFRSVIEAVPELLSPLFDRFGAVPTYLLSPEVIEDGDAADVLAALGGRAELGTHLHPQFVVPLRTIDRDTMAGRSADGIQAEFSREIEAAKLATLTDAFADRFGRRPKSFRAGRYGASGDTLELLAGLGYTVDSSVTPGLLWRYDEGRIDYRRWTPEPKWVDTAAGRILELPLTIHAASPAAGWVQAVPEPVRRVARRALCGRGDHHWLRPSWGDPNDLVAFAERCPGPVLVCMFHSIELIAGASPYAADNVGVAQILRSIEALLVHFERREDKVLGLSTIAERLSG